jgi:DNA invertase Pin-like site-specific DNA recombinase
MTGTKAIGYVRVSTNRQADNGYGIDAQRDQIERYCAANGLELVALIPDVMSGKSDTKQVISKSRNTGRFAVFKAWALRQFLGARQ